MIIYNHTREDIYDSMSATTFYSCLLHDHFSIFLKMDAKSLLISENTKMKYLFIFACNIYMYAFHLLDFT